MSDLRRSTGHANIWTEQDYEVLAREFRQISTPPDDVWIQLRLVICKVYCNWFSDKAIEHRVALGFPKELGTAIIIQKLVLGDHGFFSTRGSSDDSQDIHGHLIKGSTDRCVDLAELLQVNILQNTRIRDQILSIKYELEWMFKDMQDVEFAMDPVDEIVHVLQSKPGHRNPKANLKIAVSMVMAVVVGMDEIIKS